MLADLPNIKNCIHTVSRVTNASVKDYASESAKLFRQSLLGLTVITALGGTIYLTNR